MMDIFQGRAQAQEEDIREIFPGTLKNTYKPSKTVLEIVKYSREPLFRIEDSFWEGKRKLVPDLGCFRSIEQHASQDIPESIRKRPGSLSKYLCQPAKSELEKVRAVFWWITHNIKYDVRILTTGERHDNTPEEVLKLGNAVCEGYATLCKAMMSSVGVECRIVSGVAKAHLHWPGCLELDPAVPYDLGHLWNKVKVEGHWYLLDATWAAGTVVNSKFIYEFDESWFLADPEGFVHTHLPLYDDFDKSNPHLPLRVNTEDQLTKHPVTDFITWQRMPYQSPTCCELGMSKVSTQTGIILANRGEATLTYQTNSLFDLWVCLDKKRTENSLENLEDCGYTLLHRKEKEVSIVVRLPEAGLYVLKIFGRPWNLKQVPQNYKSILIHIEYTIVSEEGTHPPFPGQSDIITPATEFIQAGFKVLYPDSPAIQTQHGRAVIQISAPQESYLPLQTKLIGTNNYAAESLERCLYMETSEGLITIYIVCPFPGEYLLKVNIPVGRKKMASGCTFLLKCNETNLPRAVFPKGQAWSYGPRAMFYSLGMHLLYPKSSTVFTDKSRGTVMIKLDHFVECDCCLFDSNGSQMGEDCVFEETSGELMKYYLTIPDQGMYKFCIAADTKKGRQIIYSFLVVATSV